MARAVLRRTLRGLKGVMALVALAALCAWPWSYGHPGSVWRIRWALTADRADALNLESSWGDGRLRIGWTRGIYTKQHLEWGRRQAASAGGPGWTWDVHSGAIGWYDGATDSWGP